MLRLVLNKNLLINLNPIMDKSYRKDIQISKTFSYMLRHGAGEHNLKMASDEFVSLNDLLDLPLFQDLHVILEDA